MPALPVAIVYPRVQCLCACNHPLRKEGRGVGKRDTGMSLTMIFRSRTGFRSGLRKTSD